MPPPKSTPTKRNALERAIDANMRGNLDAVHAALDQYVRAPRNSGQTAADQQNQIFNIRRAEQLAAKGYPQLQRWFHRVPKKRNLVRDGGPLTAWTSPNYKLIQTVRRGPFRQLDTNNHEMVKARRNSAWLQTYMTRHALRAPALPTGAPRFPLYRGLRMTEGQLIRLLNERTWSDRGFMSFTRDEMYAAHFGGRSITNGTPYIVIFELQLADVARGTPWIWFVGDEEDMAGIDRADWHTHGSPEECEVTLPPGTLRVKSISVDIDAEDDIAYLKRKGKLRTRRNDDLFMTTRNEFNPVTKRLPKYFFSQLGSNVIVAEVAFTPAPEFAWKPPRKGTRESDDNILWNIFANDAVTRKRARQPSSSPQPSRKPRVCTSGRSCAIM